MQEVFLIQSDLARIDRLKWSSRFVPYLFVKVCDIG